MRGGGVYGWLGTLAVVLVVFAGTSGAQPCPDGDGDGLCDDVDPCTNVAAVEVLGPRLRIRKILWGPDRQRVRFSGTLTVPTSPVIDPVAKGLRIVICDAAGAESLDVTLPPGPFDPVLDRGWSSNGSGTVAKYRDRHGTVNGIKKAVVRRRALDGGEVKVVIFGQNGTYPLPTVPDVTATVVIDAPLATTGQCGEGNFGFCFFRNQGAKLLCK